MFFAPNRRRDEGGAILVLSAVGMVIAMIASGLAIDIGRLAQDAREDQKVADLAALDAYRGAVATYDALAKASAARNNFPTSAGYSVTGIEGTKVNGACVPAAGSGSVCVTVTSPHTNEFPFLAGRKTVTRTAMAGAGNAIGTVRVGSTLASVSGSIPPMDLLIYNRVMSALIGGTYSGSIAGWQGLASGTVTYGALTSQLATLTGNATFNTGTPSQVLNASFTMGQLLTAMANILPVGSDSRVAVNGIGASAAGTFLSAPLKLYSFFDFGTVTLNSKDDVANAQLNVLHMIRSGAILADGDHFASFNLTAGNVIGPVIPGGFSSAKVSMGLIEAPQQSYPGPAGKDSSNNYYTSAHTSQIRVKIDVSIKVPLTAALTTTVGFITTQVLPAGTLLDATFSYYLSGGTAHAYLDEVSCGPGAVPTGVDILGVTDVATSKLGFVSDTDLKAVSTTPIPSPTQTVLNLIGIVTVSTNSVVTTNIPGNAGVMANFSPPFDGVEVEHVPGTMVSLPSLTTASLTVNPLLLGLNTGTLLTDLVSGINSTGLTLNTSGPGVTTTILKPVYDALGLQFGTADLWAPPVQSCAAISTVPAQLTAVPVLRG